MIYPPQLLNIKGMISKLLRTPRYQKYWSQNYSQLLDIKSIDLKTTPNPKILKLLILKPLPIVLFIKGIDLKTTPKSWIIKLFIFKLLPTSIYQKY